MTEKLLTNKKTWHSYAASYCCSICICGIRLINSTTSGNVTLIEYVVYLVWGGFHLPVLNLKPQRH